MHQTRIEEAEARAEQLRTRLREEVRTDVQTDLRRRTWRRAIFRCGGCCALYALGLFTVAVLVIVMIARSGLVAVPVLKDVITRERAPIRVVAAVSGRPENLLAAKLNSLTSGSRAVVSFSEAELTAFIRSFFIGRSDIPESVRTSMQVAVTPEWIEIFARVPGVAGAQTTLRLRATPRIVDNRLAGDVHEVALGNIGVPTIIISPILQRWLAGLPPLIIPASGRIPSLAVSAIKLRDAAVDLTIEKVKGV
ncbi:MAG: hypothetical protein V1723_03340 [Candidatus Uhrbacteria bacterium]